MTNELLADGCTLADLINDLLASDPGTIDIVQLLLVFRASGDITGQDMGVILKEINSP